MIRPWDAAEISMIAPACTDDAGWAKRLAQTMPIYEINDNADRMCMWTATLIHESFDFTRLEENLNYTAERLVQVWPRRFPTLDAARPFARNPQRLAERVYGGRMGNGPEGSGDAWLFRGRGLIQITGRAMYRRCGIGLAQPLEDKPEMLLDPELAALSAGWFFADSGCLPLADANDFDGVTRRVNGGTIGMVERVAALRKCRLVLSRRTR
jgi:putative chitinase